MTAVAYLVRHGEVEHHRSDVGLTPRGRAQAEAAGACLAAGVAAGDAVFFSHSPVYRVVETAELARASLKRSLSADGRAGQVRLAPLQTEGALSNVRFILEPGREPQEPSLLYAQLSSTEYLRTMPAARAGFYRGFWSSADPMGYWLEHDSAGAAETPEVVLGRLLGWLGLALQTGAGSGCAHHIGVTHSGALRIVLRHALGADLGEPEYCAILAIQPAPAVGRAILTYGGRRAEFPLG